MGREENRKQDHCLQPRQGVSRCSSSSLCPPAPSCLPVVRKLEDPKQYFSCSWFVLLHQVEFNRPAAPLFCHTGASDQEFLPSPDAHIGPSPVLLTWVCVCAVLLLLWWLISCLIQSFPPLFLITVFLNDEVASLPSKWNRQEIKWFFLMVIPPHPLFTFRHYKHNVHIRCRTLLDSKNGTLSKEECLFPLNVAVWQIKRVISDSLAFHWMLAKD